MEIVEKIRELARAKGETFASLEKILNFSNGSIRNWNKNAPSIDKVIKIADFFEISIDELVGREKIIHSIGSDKSYTPKVLIEKYLEIIPEQEMQKEIARLELLAEQAEEKKLLG